MSDQVKQFILAKLREDYITFMQKMAHMPGSPMQKQQAFLRFDEGHMWMQNAVGSYVAPQPAPQLNAANEVDIPPNSSQFANNEQENQEVPVENAPVATVE